MQTSTFIQVFISYMWGTEILKSDGTSAYSTQIIAREFRCEISRICTPISMLRFCVCIPSVYSDMDTPQSYKCWACACATSIQVSIVAAVSQVLNACIHHNLTSFHSGSIHRILHRMLHWVLIKSYQILSNLIKSYQNLIKSYQILSNLIKSYQNVHTLFWAGNT